MTGVKRNNRKKGADEGRALIKKNRRISQNTPIENFCKQ